MYRNVDSMLIHRIRHMKSTYCPYLNNIHARILARIQSEVVNVIWGKRPHWCARFLVLALLAQPHRVEPLCARHYRVIIDCLRYLLLSLLIAIISMQLSLPFAKFFASLCSSFTLVVSTFGLL